MVKHKIIIDTNLWISLLIGKRLSDMHALCNDVAVSIYVCPELMDEFKRTANNEKIKKYATEERIQQTLRLIEKCCVPAQIKTIAVSSGLRDADDLYLLSLADTIQADYILTGDKDLLSLRIHNHTKIITYHQFVELGNESMI
jgi:putative PIN family toxin of toxin-antitoxin system